MKYTLIGCGRISPNHIAAAQNNKLYLVAICDIEVSYMVDKALKFKLGNDVKQYINYKEMIETEKPELVAICTESGIRSRLPISKRLLFPASAEFPAALAPVRRTMSKGSVFSSCCRGL